MSVNTIITNRRSVDRVEPPLLIRAQCLDWDTKSLPYVGMAQLWNVYLPHVCILVLLINEDHYDMIQEQEAVELSINSMELFCENLVPYDFPLVVLHTKSIISLHLWWMLGGSVWIWMRGNLFQFIEDQTHYSSSWHHKKSLTLNELM